MSYDDFYTSQRDPKELDDHIYKNLPPQKQELWKKIERMTDDAREKAFADPNSEACDLLREIFRKHFPHQIDELEELFEEFQEYYKQKDDKDAVKGKDVIMDKTRDMFGGRSFFRELRRLVVSSACWQNRHLNISKVGVLSMSQPQKHQYPDPYSDPDENYIREKISDEDWDLIESVDDMTDEEWVDAISAPDGAYRKMARRIVRDFFPERRDEFEKNLEELDKKKELQEDEKDIMRRTRDMLGGRSFFKWLYQFPFKKL